MIDFLLREKDKCEKAAIYHAEQLQRADIKLELICEMLNEVKRAEYEKEPMETTVEERFADGVLVDREETAVE